MRRWIRRLFAPPPPPPSFRVCVTAEEKELVEFWAERQGLPLEGFLHDAILRAIPPGERQKFALRHVRGELLDAAQAAVEDPDLY